MSFNPQVNLQHAAEAVSFLRALTDADLSRVVISPRWLVNRMPGFTIDHLQTLSEEAVVQFACDEQTRRRQNRMDRRARNALRVSIGALLVAVMALVVAFCAWRFPMK